MRIAHFIPTARGELQYPVARNMAQVETWCSVNEHSHIPLNSDTPWIDAARNNATSSAIAIECDLLLMQDADVAWPEDINALAILIGIMRADDATVVAGAVRRRSRSKRPRIAASSSKPARVYEADVGTGLMLLDVARIAELEPPWFGRELNISGTSVTGDEGPLLSKRLRAVGHKVLCAYNFPTLHWERRALSTYEDIRRSSTDDPDWTLTKQTLTPSGNLVEE